ncbi:WXG100 family type VII secretion target [Salininema proteolyticum]|uniref:ESAT-6-like protein n=1 Tax=Salininema proteolyticum TaxID=1607685 RepID=A0ABV8TW51_9ACTN
MSRIALSYQELEDASQGLKKESDDMVSALEGLIAKLDPIEWDGQDRESYEEAKTECQQALQKILEILNGIGQAVDAAKEAYQEAEANNAKSFN